MGTMFQEAATHSGNVKSNVRDPEEVAKLHQRLGKGRPTLAGWGTTGLGAELGGRDETSPPP